jgi:hypothetical protein
MQHSFLCFLFQRAANDDNNDYDDENHNPAKYLCDHRFRFRTQHTPQGPFTPK